MPPDGLGHQISVFFTTMTLDSITIANYKNIAEAQLDFSPGVNCLIGNNGMGKTNVLDTVYYLSFCKSCRNTSERAAVIKHGEDFMMLKGCYTRRGAAEQISVAMQRNKRKTVRRNGKEYARLSQHIGLLPLVMVSPMDWDLIRGSGEDRRKLMDQIISQTDAAYLDNVIRYTKAVEQRNSMIRHQYRDPLLYESVEEAMCMAAQVIHSKRAEWINVFTPIFMRYYEAIAGPGEKVHLSYRSQLNDLPMRQILNDNRERDMVIGYTTRGVHRDDIDLQLNGHPMRSTGSQGQCKTYTIALRLAQFDFLRASVETTPILLLDDIFDKLDAQRVERIVNVVAGDEFGQIFITDTNRTHLNEIVARMGGDYRLINVENGRCTTLESNSHEDKQQ